MLAMSILCKRLKKIGVDPGPLESSRAEINVIESANFEAFERDITDRSWAVRLLYTGANQMMNAAGEADTVKTLHTLISMIEGRKG